MRLPGFRGQGWRTTSGRSIIGEEFVECATFRRRMSGLGWDSVEKVYRNRLELLNKICITCTHSPRQGCSFGTDGNRVSHFQSQIVVVQILWLLFGLLHAVGFTRAINEICDSKPFLFDFYVERKSVYRVDRRTCVYNERAMFNYVRIDMASGPLVCHSV